MVVFLIDSRLFSFYIWCSILHNINLPFLGYYDAIFTVTFFTDGIW